MSPRARTYEAEVGHRFGRWIVTEAGLRAEPTPSQVARREPGFRLARVQCECGNVKLVRIDVLNLGRSTSCGCFAREVSSNTATRLGLVHGLTLTSVTGHIYSLWQNILKRTTNPASPTYEYYGGRGIKLCDRWMDATAFVADVLYEIGPRPGNLELDRIDNERGYEPGNVRWATRSQNSLNRRPASTWRKHPAGCGCAACVNRRGDAHRDECRCASCASVRRARPAELVHSD